MLLKANAKLFLKLYLDVPGRDLQGISNWKYDKNIGRFSSEIWWEKSL